MADIRAIPTRYAGVQFRSRLEAQWAAFFNLLDWSWEYEVLDLAGYVPDFLVRPNIADDDYAMLVEVKPEINLQRLHEHTAKVDRSGWRRLRDVSAFAVVGAVLFDRADAPIMGILSASGDASWMSWRPQVYADAADLWKAAKNEVQYQRCTRRARPYVELALSGAPPNDWRQRAGSIWKADGRPYANDAFHLELAYRLGERSPTAAALFVQGEVTQVPGGVHVKVLRRSVGAACVAAREEEMRQHFRILGLELAIEYQEGT